MKKAVAIFSILMGLMMLGTWAYLFLFNLYPQAKTLPVETGYLLVAESLTSLGLIAGGFGTLLRRNWGLPLSLVALGELVYCTIRFAGELGQSDSVAGMMFFTAVGAFGIGFAVYLVFSVSRQRWKS